MNADDMVVRIEADARRRGIEAASDEAAACDDPDALDAAADILQARGWPEGAAELRAAAERLRSAHALSIADAVRVLCAARGWTQADLAHRLGVTPQAMRARMARGISATDRHDAVVTVDAIAGALGVEPDELRGLRPLVLRLRVVP